MLANIPVVRVNSLSTTALYIKVSLIRWTAPVYFWLMPLSFRHIKVAVIFVFNINPHSFFIYNEKRASQEPADGSLSRRCAPSADSHGTFQLNVWVKRTHHLSKSAHLFTLAYLYFSIFCISMFCVYTYSMFCIIVSQMCNIVSLLLKQAI